jgi:hypothetical protein
MNLLSARLTGPLAKFNERINQVCPRRVQLGPNVDQIEFKIQIDSNGMACLWTERLKTQSVDVDDMPFFIESMLQAFDLEETLNT